MACLQFSRLKVRPTNCREGSIWWDCWSSLPQIQVCRHWWARRNCSPSFPQRKRRARKLQIRPSSWRGILGLRS